LPLSRPTGKRGQAHQIIAAIFRSSAS
jgi:hypothetical protein